MRRLRRAALLSELADKLHEHDSWVGETHLQKGVFLLQELCGVPTDVEYVLFKHGPFSWQLREELGEMRSDHVLRLVPQRPPYGPRFYPDEAVEQLRRQYPKTLCKYEVQLNWMAEQLGSRGVVELEKLATAFWVTQELGDDADVRPRASRLHELKPHFDLAECVEAVREIDEMRDAAPVVGRTRRATRSSSPTSTVEHASG
jgi:hypothetical protein